MSLFNFLHKRILELRENGLLQHWQNKYNPKLDKCMDAAPKKDKNHPISLKNLTGAFVVLLVGYFISLISFLVETSLCWRILKTLSSVFKCYINNKRN